MSLQAKPAFTASNLQAMLLKRPSAAPQPNIMPDSQQQVAANSWTDPVPLTPQNAVKYLIKRQGVKAIHGTEGISLDGVPAIRVHFTDTQGNRGAAEIWQEPEGIYGEW